MAHLRGVSGAVAAAVVVSAVGLVALPAQAQSAATTFVAVDAVQLHSNGVNITGLVQGESTPRTVFANIPANDYASAATVAAACQRAATLVMLKPGQFVLRLDPVSQGYTHCTLAKVTP